MPLLAYGTADITYGNGLIAAFVAGVVLAIVGRDAPERSLQFNETAATGLGLVVLFAMLVLGSGIGDAELVFRLALYGVLGSVLLHGLTDSSGVHLIDGRRDLGPVRATRPVFHDERDG